MHLYEIRVVGPTGRTLIASQEMHPSDHAAIRSGQVLSNGSAFEVWRDLDCIHRAAAYERKTDAANENTPRPKAS
jgi:hypothetical protein